MLPSAKEIEDFLAKYENADPLKLRLKLGRDFSVLIDQLEARKRLTEKLPDWIEKRGIVFPPKANLEQTSSSATSKYKRLLKSGTKGCDLTLGSGIDAHAMLDGGTMIGIEPNAELVEITKHNLNNIWKDDIRIFTTTAEEFLASNQEEFDWIFVDPSRRDQGKRTYRLEDHFPNLIELGNDILDRTTVLIVKLSPIFDIAAAIDQLVGVSEIHVVAVHREVKELLVVCSSTTKNESPIIKAVSLDFEGKVLFEVASNSLNAEKSFSDPLKYLYEPHPAVVKAGLQDFQANVYGLNKLAPLSHLYTSDTLISDYPGRTFEIEQTSAPYKNINRDLGRSIVTKNYPESVEFIRKKSKLKDDSDAFLFATSLENKRTIFIFCKCINRV